MEMYNLAFDANFANNATSQCVCVITMNWQSHFEGNQFFNGCSHNFVMTDTTTGGTQITGSGPQTSFKRNYLSTANNDLFHQTSAGTAWGTDGVMTGNFFNTTGTDGSGCWFDLAAGWEIGGNHYYGIGGVAIYANGSIGTRIHDNYIESFGNTGHTTGPYAGYYSGINATCYNGYSVEIHNNIIGCNEPAGGSRYDFVNVSNKTGQETATCSITDNVLFSYNITTKGNGIWAAADSAGGLSLIIDGNAIPNVHTPIGYVNNCTILPATVGVGIGNSSNASSTPGTYASIPPTSAAIQTALGNLALGTAYHNTLTYDVWLTIYLGITANTSGVVKDGVGTTTTPTQTTIITGSTLTGIVPIRAKIPAGQYRLLSLSGTVLTPSLASTWRPCESPRPRHPRRTRTTCERPRWQAVPPGGPGTYPRAAGRRTTRTPQDRRPPGVVLRAPHPPHGHPTKE